MFFEGADVPATVEDITVSAQRRRRAGDRRHDRLDRRVAAAAGGGVTTPPADPAQSDGTATPASTPEGGAAQ